jgi:hypothetical protein
MPKKMPVSAVVPERKDSDGNVTQAQLGPCTVEVEFGETAEESISMFGDEAVNSNAFANWRVILQANIRSALKRGETEGDIQSRLAGAKLGVAQAGGKVDVEAAFKAKFASASPEERKKMIAQLKELAAA